MSPVHGLELASVPVVIVGTVVALSIADVDIPDLTYAMAAMVAVIFTGVAQLIVALRTNRKTDANMAVAVETKAILQDTKVAVQETKAVAVETKAVAETVSHAVNSAASTSVGDNKSLQREVAELKLQIAEFKQVAALVAQAHAQAQSAPVAPVALVVPAVPAVPTKDPA